jgi:hypothetical protein
MLHPRCAPDDSNVFSSLTALLIGVLFCLVLDKSRLIPRVVARKLFLARSLSLSMTTMSISTVAQDAMGGLCSFCLRRRLPTEKNKEREKRPFFLLLLLFLLIRERQRRRSMMFVGYIKATFERYLWEKGATGTRHSCWWEKGGERASRWERDVLFGEGIAIWSDSCCCSFALLLHRRNDRATRLINAIVSVVYTFTCSRSFADLVIAVHQANGCSFIYTQMSWRELLSCKQTIKVKFPGSVRSSFILRMKRSVVWMAQMHFTTAAADPYLATFVVSNKDRHIIDAPV